MYCGSELVVRTGMHGKHVKAQRYHCKACGKWFNDKSGTVFSNSNLPLRTWLFAAFLLQFRVSVMEFSRALGIGYKAPSSWFGSSGRASTPGKEEKLRGEVEMDEAYVKAGLKGKRGLRRAPRRRGLKTRGRGTSMTRIRSLYRSRGAWKRQGKTLAQRNVKSR